MPHFISKTTWFFAPFVSWLISYMTFLAVLDCTAQHYPWANTVAMIGVLIINVSLSIIFSKITLFEIFNINIPFDKYSLFFLILIIIIILALFIFAPLFFIMT